MQIFFKLNTSQEVPHLKFNTPPIEFFFRKFLMCILWVVDQNLFDIPLQIIIIFCFFLNISELVVQANKDTLSSF